MFRLLIFPFYFQTNLTRPSRWDCMERETFENMDRLGRVKTEEEEQQPLPNAPPLPAILAPSLPAIPEGEEESDESEETLTNREIDHDFRLALEHQQDEERPPKGERKRRHSKK